MTANVRYEVDIWSKPGRVPFADCVRRIITDWSYQGARGWDYTYTVVEDDSRIYDDVRVYVELEVTRPDANTGTVGVGRPWRTELYPSMSETQIVHTLFGMALGYDEHEAREAATYRGRRVFGPHIDIGAQWVIAQDYEQRHDGPSKTIADGHRFDQPTPEGTT